MLAAMATACADERPTDGANTPSRRTSATEFKFVEIGKSAGLVVPQITGGPQVDHIIESVGAGAAWLDYDLDGDLDLYLAQGATAEAPRAGPPDLFYRNEGDPDGDGIPRFVEVGSQVGLGDTLWSFGVAVADFDSDGDPDIFLCNWGPNRLYRNDGGTFVEIGEPAKVADPRWSVSAAWSDVDRDGDLDLYVANYVAFDFGRYPARGERPGGGEPPCVWKGLEIFCGPRNLEAERGLFYRNDGDPDGDGIPRFVEAGREVGLVTDDAYYALALYFFDADDDGDDDLYIANDSVQNSFFVNRGDGNFVDDAIIAGLAYDEQGKEQASMGIATADYDGDGDVDLITTSFSHDHDTLYRNEGDNLFTDVSYAAGIGTPSFFALAWGVSFDDLDRDGWEDLLIARGHVYPQVDSRPLGTSFRQRNALFRNQGDGTFVDRTDEAGPGLADAASHRALVPADFDRDGDIDYLVTRLGEPPALLRNDGPARSWLEVRLAGSASSRDGVGAQVRVGAGGRTQTRQITRTASLMGSSEPIAHFGLGSIDTIDWIEVLWPSGRTSRVEGVATRQLLTLREPDR